MDKLTAKSKVYILLESEYITSKKADELLNILDIIYSDEEDTDMNT